MPQLARSQGQWIGVTGKLVDRQAPNDLRDLAVLCPDEVAENDLLRSRVVRALVASPPKRHWPPIRKAPAPRLVQFWDSKTIPPDVRECLETWRSIEEYGITRILFDDQRAREYIARHYGPAHCVAFAQCRHPAMRSDYFRLCFMAREGGIYVDADDVYVGRDPAFLLRDHALHVRALCYDPATDAMVPSSRLAAGDRGADWIYYVNNNPLIAPAKHPILRLALVRATRALLTQTEAWPDVQSTTGPGNLTACLVRHALVLHRQGKPMDFVVQTDWDSFAVSRWPLSYRGDARNWRLWRRPL